MDAGHPLVADEMTRFAAREGGKAHAQFAGGDAIPGLAHGFAFRANIDWTLLARR